MSGWCQMITVAAEQRTCALGIPAAAAARPRFSPCKPAVEEGVACQRVSEGVRLLNRRAWQHCPRVPTDVHSCVDAWQC